MTISARSVKKWADIYPFKHLKERRLDLIMRTVEFKMERPGIVKDVRENSRGFYVVVDFDEEDVH